MLRSKLRETPRAILLLQLPTVPWKSISILDAKGNVADDEERLKCMQVDTGVRISD